MPTRLIYEKTCVSETLSELSAEEERMFFRLITKADDHGRYYARPAVLLGNLFPLHAGISITASQVQDWRDRLEEVGLIQVYEVEGREYLVITTWSTHQRQRANSSKFPDPPFRGHPHADADNGGQMPPVPGTRYPVSGGREAMSGGRGPGGAVLSHAAAAPPLALPADEKAQDAGFAVPDSVAGFHEVMTGTQGYRPSPAFLRQVAERYGQLDLTHEALTMADWLADTERNRRNKRPTAKFLLGWLDRSLEDRSATAVPERRGTVDRPEPIEDAPPVEVPELAAEPEAVELWDAALGELRLSMSVANFEAYLAGTVGVALNGDGLTVAVSNPLIRAQLGRFRQHVARAALDAAGRQIPVQFVSGRVAAAVE